MGIVRYIGLESKSEYACQNGEWYRKKVGEDKYRRIRGVRFMDDAWVEVQKEVFGDTPEGRRNLVRPENFNGDIPDYGNLYALDGKGEIVKGEDLERVVKMKGIS